MTHIWERPYQCDRWEIATSFIGRTLFRRREKWRATARGYRNGEEWAVYLGFWFERAIGHGETREEAEHAMRAIICEDVAAYRRWVAERRFAHSEFDREGVCP